MEATESSWTRQAQTVDFGPTTKMTATLTFNDFKDDLYRRLEQLAAAHGRSVNDEAIAALAKALQALEEIVANPVDGASGSPSVPPGNDVNTRYTDDQNRQDGS